MSQLCVSVVAMPSSSMRRTCAALVLLCACCLSSALRAPSSRPQNLQHASRHCKLSLLHSDYSVAKMGPLYSSSLSGSGEKEGVRNDLIKSLKSHLTNVMAIAAKLRSKFLLLPLLAVAFFLSPLSVRRALAASGAPFWDLYGRVPHDDWLFNMWTLTSPNLLKKSIVEAVVEELPDVLLNLKGRKRINEFLVVFGGFAYFALGIAVVTVLYKGAIRNYRQKTLRDDNLRGYKLPTSAISKNAAKKGKQIDNMDAGWVDMELPADDINSKDEDDGEEEEEEEEESRDDKKKRRR